MMLLPTYFLTLLSFASSVTANRPLPLIAVSQQRNLSAEHLSYLRGPVHEIRCLETPILNADDIDPLACASNIETICISLTGPNPCKGKWIWTMTQGCALGYYISNYPSSRPRMPTIGDCQRMFGQMIDRCAFRSPPRVGVVNVKILPDLHTGTAIRDGYPRYILAERVLSRYEVKAKTGDG